MKKILASLVVLAMVVSSFSVAFAEAPILVPEYGITIDSNKNVFINGIQLNGFVEPILSQDETFGFGRLVNTMHKGKATDAKLVGCQIAADGKSVIVTVQSSLWWANGNWKVTVTDFKPENQVAPQGGYWYCLYDKAGKCYGICKAIRL